MDLGVAFDPVSMTGDIGFDGRNLLLDATPASQLLVALGTDRRALASDDLPDAYSSTNPQGTLAGRRGTAIDALDPLGRRIGSRLWLLARQKLDEEVRRKAEGYVGEALAGMDAQLGTDLVYQVTIPARDMLGVTVQAGPHVATFLTGRTPPGVLAASAAVTPAVVTLDARPTPATYLDGNGVLIEVGPNVLRPLFAGGVQTGNLIEGAATNYVTNPRGEGAVVGTPGTAPTDWTFGIATGLTQTIADVGTFDGIPYVDVTISGTMGGAGLGLALDAFFASPAVVADGEPWTQSIWAQIVAGSIPTGQTMNIIMGEYNGTVVYAGFPSAAPAAWTRYVNTQTISAGNTSADGMVWVYAAAGQVVNFTLRLAGPQFEQGTAATSLILPPAGSPGTSTRAADTVWSPV